MKNKIINTIKALIESALLGLIIALVIINFVFMSVSVAGKSMEPNLHENQRGLSFIFAKAFGIDRFDIVVLKNDENDKLIVKRVIGLPNETITYKDNKLYVDGNYTLETFLSKDAYTNNLTITLDEDEYFCLGDNRIISRDSRYYGPFNKDQIKSKGVLVIYPFNQIGLH